MDIDLEIEKLQLKEPTESDCEREKTYLLAEDLNQNLAQMETNVSYRIIFLVLLYSS